MILRDLGDSIPSRTCENLVPGKSAFDLFNVVFGGKDRVILLREHFRCVPDIIRFCNKHFYDESLIPLKQGQQGFGSPVQMQFVRGGTASKDTEKPVNEMEAQAIVLHVRNVTFIFQTILMLRLSCLCNYGALVDRP